MLWCGESCLSSFWSLCGLYVRRLLWCALCGRRMTVTYAWTHPRYKSASCIIVQRERERVRVPGRFFYRRVEREPRERCAPLLWLSLHLYSNSFAMPTMDTTQPNHTPHNKAKSKVHALNSLPQIISSPRTRSSLLAARIDVAALSPEHIDL